jgi:hypothetical protein
VSSLGLGLGVLASYCQASCWWLPDADMPRWWILSGVAQGLIRQSETNIVPEMEPMCWPGSGALSCSINLTQSKYKHIWRSTLKSSQGMHLYTVIASLSAMRTTPSVGSKPGGVSLFVFDRVFQSDPNTQLLCISYHPVIQISP